MIEVIAGDCLEALPRLPADSVDACVTDPPYGLSQEPDIAEVLRHWLAGDDYKHRGSGFMGKSWDSFVPGPSYWREVFRVLKPGAHLLCFAGTRTQDLMGIALRMAGFEIRDCIRYEQGREAWPAWFYGTGFPKSLNVSYAIDDHFFHEWLRAHPEQASKLKGLKGEARKEVEDELRRLAGLERRVVAPPPYSRGKTAQSYSETRKVSYDCDPQPITAPATPEAAQWAGWGTSLKPAYEPVLVARKPLSERTVAANVLKYGCGALNVDESRIEAQGRPLIEKKIGRPDVDGKTVFGSGLSPGSACAGATDLGRWPANLIHDGSQEVLDAFAAFGERTSGKLCGTKKATNKIYGTFGSGIPVTGFGDSGSAARFFYSAKASKADRMGTTHPTTKPVSLIEYLCRLVTPPGGTVLDPFAGSGTLVPAARRLGVNAILIEREPEYIADIERRIANDTEAVQRKDHPPAPPPAESSPTLFDAIAVG